MELRIPNVLLLGNGINRRFGDMSWEQLLANISCRGITADEVKAIDCPSPLKAVYLSEDNVSGSIKKMCAGKSYTIISNEEADLIREYLSIGFDDIMTSNYSYEIELSALNTDRIKENRLARLAEHTNEVKRCESKYMLHTYYPLSFGEKHSRIWHIHGEYRKPDSMVLGHYYYASLLGRLTEINRSRKNSYSLRAKYDTAPKLSSWFDSFIWGNVYVVGFGFALSETDMWWLINRKKRETAPKGKLYFYNTYDENDENSSITVELLRIMGAEVIDIPVRDNNWVAAYKTVCSDIKKRMKGE